MGAVTVCSLVNHLPWAGPGRARSRSARGATGPRSCRRRGERERNASGAQVEAKETEGRHWLPSAIRRWRDRAMNGLLGSSRCPLSAREYTTRSVTWQGACGAISRVCADDAMSGVARCDVRCCEMRCPVLRDAMSAVARRDVRCCGTRCPVLRDAMGGIKARCRDANSGGAGWESSRGRGGRRQRGRACGGRRRRPWRRCRCRRRGRGSGRGCRWSVRAR
jgi:hypothetical protein